MKRLVIVILMLCLLPSASIGEIDLSEMSFDELIELKEQINLALWECEEWQEVEVPVGVYEVGNDIPEGHWVIHASGKYYTEITWCYALDSTGKSYAKNSRIMHDLVFSQDYKRYDPESMVSEIDLDLRDGQFLIIENAPCIFEPYTGNRDLGFR